jgi:ATP-binding cassette subfamily C protein
MALLVIGGWRVVDGSLSIGMLVAFQLLMVSFQRPVNRLVSFASILQTLQGNLQRLDDVLGNEIDPQLTLEVAATPAVVPLRPQLTGVPEAPLYRLRGAIDIENLSFGYHPLAPPLIDNLSLAIEPGQRVAFVGGSGSGKSTLAKVIAGLYQPLSGEVRFDGIPRRQIPRAVLTNSIAVVEQDILIFEGTIRDNLTLWDTTISDRDLVRSAQDAAIEDVIVAQPSGYDTQLLEGASNLSGGQRQRMEIARALVGNPPS